MSRRWIPTMFNFSHFINDGLGKREKNSSDEYS